MHRAETYPPANRAAEVTARHLRRSVISEVHRRRRSQPVSSEVEVDSAHRVRRKAAANPAAMEAAVRPAAATVAVATMVAGAAIMAAAS
jgi:hypothetical protein